MGATIIVSLVALSVVAAIATSFSDHVSEKRRLDPGWTLRAATGRALKCTFMVLGWGAVIVGCIAMPWAIIIVMGGTLLKLEREALHDKLDRLNRRQ